MAADDFHTLRREIFSAGLNIFETHSHVSSSILASFAGDMFGLGTLTLPASFARLGWLPALLFILLCLFGTIYTGRLFTLLARQVLLNFELKSCHCLSEVQHPSSSSESSVRQSYWSTEKAQGCKVDWKTSWLQVPSARTFDDFGKAAMGVKGQRIVYVAVYTTILLNPIIFQLTSVESLQQILFGARLPEWALGLVVAGLMLPLAQVILPWLLKHHRRQQKAYKRSRHLVQLNMYCIHAYSQIEANMNEGE